MINELRNILNDLSKKGKVIYFEGANENIISNFEEKNNITIPIQLREYYLFSDGGEFFLPAGIQIYGISHKPIIDIDDNDKPNSNYFVIGSLSNGDPILCEKNSGNICIYNHEKGCIENDEIYQDFLVFLKELPNMLGL